MAVSPADFELYSRSTGRPIPRNPQERMQMTPEVYNFVQNRGYQQSGPTFIQQGADFLSKAATVGGALVAANALAGGFNKKGVSHLFAVMKAHFTFYFAIPKLISKRRKSSQKYNLTGKTNYSILVKNKLKGIKKFSDL